MKKDKIFADFYRLLESQEFKTGADINKFMKSISGQPIPLIPKEGLSAKDQAQDLIYGALELPKIEALKKVEEALKLDPNCIDAYEYLGSIENSVEKAMVQYAKGIAIGRELFGGEYLAENKGRFWGLYETRPFMRCLQHYADCLYSTGNKRDCIAVLEELIELNPNDNQGVRDQLLLYLLEMKEFEKFIKYAIQYDGDDAAFTLFTKALYAFIIEGASDNASTKLKAAIKSNKYVAKRLLSKKTINALPEMYGIGDINEADYYACFARHIWRQTIGATEWLRKNI
jgi:tetratricopeptide (TPR) repeat protein